ncbi:chromosome-associated kinesin KIF4-like [Daphnia pulicaria]|uniref:chromosome-associated kinesin KIF4-like n=1 Tax=Daphnia pulicaria TaxID=35523 RepID=UPI001EEAC78B|nr:chromosome-associated kinesin KIF4-like [Daphnia pulicaria]
MDVPVRVQVRIKPPTNSKSENDEKYDKDSILVKLSSTKVRFNEEKEFQFDHVYETDCNQKEIFDNSAVPLLKQLVSGYNVTVMAYGPTGSGKSYTLGTCNTETPYQHDEAGLLTQIISWIFSRKTASTEEDGQISKVQVSFLEIYKEEIFDLLSSVLKRIEIKNDKVENVVMENITEMEVHNQENTLDLIRTANLRRQVKKTKSNDSSSRSHAIISLKLEIHKNGESRFSTFKIVDLAGSEAVAKDGVMGEIKNEGIFINKGLLALGKVISALNSKNVSHIPHRESNLTRALKDSLSGNSLTVLICCVKADFQSITTTSAALQFASKARAIKTKVQPSVFKTPFKVPPVQSQFKTPGKTPFKTPGSLPYRTPLAPIQRNKATSPMGASFAVPEKISMLEKYEDLDESVLLAGSFDRRNLPKLSETNDIENRIQKAVMERVDIFLEGFKDKLAQSLLANCSGAHLSCRSLLDGNSANSSSHARRSELDALNLTSALGENKTLTSQSIGSRRRSVRLAEKRMTLLSNSNMDESDSRPTTATLRRSTATRVSKRSPALPLPIPEGKSPENINKYRKDLLHYLNYASQSQIQKLPSVGPKAGHSIITFRNLNGMLNDFETLKRVPGLRKNFHENFMKVNFLE